MGDKIIIFGYGSLINIHSLHKTLPEVKTLVPAILKGYKRVFDTASKHRINKKGIHISTLNIIEEKNSFLNGICFEVSKERFNNLTSREGAYISKKVLVESFSNKKSIDAIVFIGKDTEKQPFIEYDDVQQEYLDTCIQGAKMFSKEFHDMFLETTFIGVESLKTQNKQI